MAETSRLDLSVRPKRPLVAASILSADFGRIADECRDVLDAGADLLHVDVMDGHFVPNLTMGQDMISGLRRHFPDTYLDVHLMVERPGDYVDSFAEAGADCFNFHVEVCRPHEPDGVDAGALIERIRAAGMDVGMTINPPTEAATLGPYLDQLDLALVMSVHPGRSGQRFIEDALDKARWLRQRLPATCRVEMDGGLNRQTAVSAAAAGVEILVTASALFGAEDRPAVVDAMHDAPLASIDGGSDDG